MTKTELVSLLVAESKSNYGVWWVPISWATAVAEQAFRDGHIKHERHLLEINTELIFNFRIICATSRSLIKMVKIWNMTSISVSSEAKCVGPVRHPTKSRPSKYSMSTLLLEAWI